MWTKQKHRLYHLRYYHKRRTELIARFGGMCAKCGSTENLEFDHKNRDEKTFNISSILLKRVTPEIEVELAKCQLLCKSCHEQKTSQENLDVGFEHGSMYGLMKKRCSCDLCVTAKRAWHDRRNAARRLSGDSPTGRRRLI